MNFLPGFLAADPSGYTVARLADHIEHVASVAGADHVGLGPDFVREVFTDLTPPCCEDPAATVDFDVMATLPGLAGPSGLPLVTGELLARGRAEPDIRGILGGNLHRLLAAHLA
ncbi:membrane dipeptidase [Actinomadura sp. 3N407]|uniref:membrane dipeptidase n=1 Tax=Actinomadura sp. 3N407 TaxID=3457423 RepID=UPI003FCD0604